MGIALRAVSFTYLPGTPLAREVLRNVDLEIREGEVTCLLGRTGSGKSTLLQLAAGLLLPTSGEVLLDGREVSSGGEGYLALRREVGLLMQSPEMQLFAGSVEEDVAFGLRHLGLSPSEARERVFSSLALVGLDPDSYAHLPPLGLSQGEMRRVALAGVLVRKPRVLLLDEPSSGLDRPSQEDLRRILLSLKEEGVGILLVTHDWEEVETLADRVSVLHGGSLFLQGTPEGVLAQVDSLREAGLYPPPVAEVFHLLRQGGLDLPRRTGTARQAAAVILRALQRAG